VNFFANGQAVEVRPLLTQGTSSGGIGPFFDVLNSAEVSVRHRRAITVSSLCGVHHFTQHPDLMMVIKTGINRIVRLRLLVPNRCDLIAFSSVESSSIAVKARQYTCGLHQKRTRWLWGSRYRFSRSG